MEASAKLKCFVWFASCEGFCVVFVCLIYIIFFVKGDGNKRNKMPVEFHPLRELNSPAAESGWDLVICSVLLLAYLR